MSSRLNHTLCKKVSFLDLVVAAVVMVLCIVGIMSLASNAQGAGCLTPATAPVIVNAFTGEVIFEGASFNPEGYPVVYDADSRCTRIMGRDIYRDGFEP